MATIKPFQAIRTTRDKASLVSSRSYEAYSPAELGAILDFNPFSFLHIINPGYKYHQEITGQERFKLVHNRYDEFKENGIFIKDKKPAFYIYKKSTENTSYCGIIAAISTLDYKDNIIKKHEDTLHKREVLFKNYLKTTSFNAEPVLLTYPDNEKVQQVINKYLEKRSEYEFCTKNKKVHQIWLVNKAEDIYTITSEFNKINAIYIADGHHRCASSYLLSQDLKEQNPNHTGEEAYNFFMSFLLPESKLTISEFNRFVKDLNGLTKEQFLLQLDKVFKIENKGHQLYKPSKKHHFSMYLDGDFYALHLRETVFHYTDALSDLDAQILYQKVLQPLLGIHDLRTDNRIAYKHSNNDFVLKTNVDSGKFKVAFGMFPVTIDQLKKVADQGLKMPPKSTYIEPKLRSGLLMYEFND